MIRSFHSKKALQNLVTLNLFQDLLQKNDINSIKCAIAIDAVPNAIRDQHDKFNFAKPFRIKQRNKSPRISVNEKN